MRLHFDFKLLTAFCAMVMAGRFFLPQVWGLSVLFLGGLFYQPAKKHQLSTADVIMGAALVMEVWYVFASWGNVRQYDYFNFFMHADYFLQNDFFLFNPKSYIYTLYFQPPLWGLIAGVVTKVFICLGDSAEAAFDYVRFVNLWCVGGCFIFFWRLMELCRFDDRLKIWLFMWFCFFPTHNILSNLVNNDAAVYFLMLAGSYYSWRWFQNSSWRYAGILSLIFAISGLIKFSGLMIVPAFGVLALLKLADGSWRDWKLWGQLALVAFGVITGFFWGLFLLYYHLPLVPPPLDVSYQSMSGFSLTERLFGLQGLSTLFVDVHAGLIEPNVWLALVKTSLFGEWRWQGDIWAFIMLLTALSWALFSVWSFFALFYLKAGKSFEMNVFMVVLTLSVLGAWCYFWLEYPFFCSSEYRYVAILFPLSLLWGGNYLQHKKLPKTGERVLAVSLILFIAAQFMLYLNTI